MNMTAFSPGQPGIVWTVALVFAGAGLWLQLSASSWWAHALGGLFGLVAVATLAAAMPRFGDESQQLVFWFLAGVTVISAGVGITARNPVHMALWFALSLLGSSGLLLFQGAQFLGVTTIVVYAGAIVVTFLFLLMLAQPQGFASYDRVSWAWFAAPLSLLAGVALMLTLLISLTDWRGATHGRPAAKLAANGLDAPHVLDKHHMARLGGELFARHLVSVEVVGSLLLVALVGAVAIVLQGKLATTADAESGAAGRALPTAARSPLLLPTRAET